MQQPSMSNQYRSPPRIEYDFIFKLIVLGDTAVGKSCLLERYANDRFYNSHIPTIGVDFKIKTVPIEDKLIKLQIWDTAGQERFRSITRNFYRGIHGAMIVYDVTNAKSFESVPMWRQEIIKHTRSNVPVLLVGSKADLGKARVVSSEEGRELADRLGMMFLETSAMTAVGVNEAFYSLTHKVTTDTGWDRFGKEISPDERNQIGRSKRVEPLPRAPHLTPTLKLGRLSKIKQSCCNS